MIYKMMLERTEWQCNPTSILNTIFLDFFTLTATEKTTIEKRKEEPRPFLPIARHMDKIFEDFRRDMESMFHSWPYSMVGWHLPILTDIERGLRLPVCELCDMGDRYELQLEMPGIDKDKVDVKANKNSIEISAEQSIRI
jgi:HSP20 family protein